MAKYIITITDLAKKQLQQHKKAGDKATLQKISRIFEDLENNPFSGVGNPEQLKYNLSGFWSRRINKKDRIIYTVNNLMVTVEVISAMGHYSDK